MNVQLWQILKDIESNRAKHIEIFITTYLAVNASNVKLTPEYFNRLRLIQNPRCDGSFEYWIEDTLDK